jgi:stage V sporulation protein G
MNVTEIRVKLLKGQPDKLRGFASLTIHHCLVVRDLKIIEGPSGLFVAMPSRKLCDRCAQCGGKNHLRARHCNDCGVRLREQRGGLDERGRPRLYADIAHPINQESRDYVQGLVLAAFREELERSQQAGYVGVSFDDLDYECYEPGEAPRPPQAEAP